MHKRRAVAPFSVTDSRYRHTSDMKSSSTTCVLNRRRSHTRPISSAASCALPVSVPYATRAQRAEKAGAMITFSSSGCRCGDGYQRLWLALDTPDLHRGFKVDENGVWIKKEQGAEVEAEVGCYHKRRSSGRSTTMAHALTYVGLSQAANHQCKVLLSDSIVPG
jgi:hypothetical protein